ncbi:MAG: hypothetical protein JSS32_07760 [Verrucomicrobia bacterium]|nr:hypothetical protein [Verrucomicrobiota bacterium]
MTDTATKKKHAPESHKTRKAREKLLETFKKQDAQITHEALQATLEKIHQWISDHNDSRVTIKGKPIRLFAQNQNAAETSKKVKEFAQMLQQSHAISNNPFAAEKKPEKLLDPSKLLGAAAHS